MNMKENNIKFIFGNSADIISDTIKDNSVQLIYLDPPFYKQSDLKQYCKYENKIYTFSDKWQSLNCYLNFISDILLKCREKILDSGLIFLHCDNSAGHYLRILLDKIFGEKYFINEIIWYYKRWSNSAKKLLESHQTIFVYSKTKDYKFNKIMMDYSPTTNVDQILQYRVRDENGVVKYKKDHNNNIETVSQKNGVPLRDVWDIPFLNPKAKERTGYPTQKPIELMNRIIQLSCSKGDLILDPFCGSGSMGISAQINNCKYIGIDNNKEAIKLCNKRINEYYVSDSAVKDGNYKDFYNLDKKIKDSLVSLKAIPVERNKGIDGILSTSNGIIGIRFQRQNETIGEVIKLLNNASKNKNFLKKIIVKNFDSDLFEMIPDDIIIIDSLEYKINKEITKGEKVNEIQQYGT
ncbi:methyltransferase [Spirochaetia bacterium]|nr:methyltransferase [Spirochaetia bacterium]